MGTLRLIATPIGNLADITDRARAVRFHENLRFEEAKTIKITHGEIALDRP